MFRYQIRTPEKKVLSDVLREIAEGGWTAIADLFEAREISKDDYSEFEQQLIGFTTPNIRAFRLCGLSNVCTDLVKSAPLAGESGKQSIPDVNPWDLIYHLILRVEVNEFIDGLTATTLDASRHLLRQGTRTRAFMALSEAYRKALRNYVYFNPICGNSELCSLSGRAPVEVKDQR
jgi:hypothetical protein